MRASPAVLLDRDGTLVVERHYLAQPDQLELLPGVVPALRRLRDAGFELVVVTNQSAIARGLVDEAGLARIHERLHEMLEGLPRAYLHCPHHPDAGAGPYRRPCDCRKPAPGLIARAAALFELDLRRSWIVGDSARDVLAGRALGLRGALVRSGQPLQPAFEELARVGYVPDLVVDDLPAAAAAILGAPASGV